MAWQRLGLVWGPDGSRIWARSHASHPVPVHLGEDRFRVFFGTRDAENRSAIGWVDAVLPATRGEAMRITAVGDEALLLPGGSGAHDDSGLGMGSIVRADGIDHLYYMGWNLGVRAPWRNSIGLARGDVASPRFARAFVGPIMDRSPEDPFTLSYPWVMRLGPRDWRMWYGSNVAWGAETYDMQHLIKHARSEDGVVWHRYDRPALDFADAGEYAMARPTVVREPAGFAMWFTTRGPYYRIGAAFSRDGEVWERRDASHGLDRAGAGNGEAWDGSMACYPCVFDHGSRRLMLYNGDRYGHAGFGMAEWMGAER